MTIRDRIIEEALTWQRTPWHHRACIKGVGVDCVFFVIGVYNALGITKIANGELPQYPADIMMHRNEETVLDGIARYAHEVAVPQKGDVALWKFGRIFSHAAIVIDLPTIIHAHRASRMVTLDDASQGDFSRREVRYFSFFGAVE